MSGEQWEATLDRVLELTVLLSRDMADSLADTGFVTREPHPSDRRATLVTFTERGRATAQALVDSHRRLARQVFADLPDDAFEGFDAGLVHVISKFRAVLAERASDQ